jgi:hypothetical protein
MQQDRYIRTLLEQINSGKSSSGFHIVTRKLSEKVWLARIWLSEENKVPMEIYLLKEGSDYMGAVQEKDTQLFAYSVPSFRRKGIVKTALKEIIIPHLLARNPILRTTLSRSLVSEKMYTAGKHLALSVGFEILKEEDGLCRMLLDGTKLQKRIFIQGENIPLTSEEKATIKSYIGKSVLYMSIAQCMLEYREGRSPLSEDFLDIIRKLNLLLEKV